MIKAYLQLFSELPGEFSNWALTLSDTTFLSLMFAGGVLLAFVIARALR